MEIYDPTCGSGGLLVKCEIAMEQSAKGKKRTLSPLKLFGQEFTPETWAMANMNMIIHDMEGQIDTGAASRGSGNAGTNKEKTVRQWFVEHDIIESVLYLPENLDSQ